jgi:hypothetical protein
MLKRITVEAYQRNRRSYIFEARIDLAAVLSRAVDDGADGQLFKDEILKLYPEVFAEMTGLPPEREEDMTIVLDPEKPKPKSRPNYKLTEKELKVLRERLRELLQRGFLRPSTSDFAASILFAKKADGDLRLCVDYRGLNDCTVKVRSPLPNVSEMRNRLRDAKFSTKLDLRDGYHNIRIKEEDIHNTAFKCFKKGAFIKEEKSFKEF